MYVDTQALRKLVEKGGDRIAQNVEGTGYLPRTVTGVAMFLLDNEGNYDLLTARQQLIFEKFLRPLL